MLQLKQASELAPDNARYAYVYAVALNSTGAGEEAVAVLERMHALQPANREVLTALTTFVRARGDLQATLRYARELSALDPSDPRPRTLVQQLQRHQAP